MTSELYNKAEMELSSRGFFYPQDREIMEHASHSLDTKIEDLRKNVDFLTTTVVNHLNKINRLIRELEHPNVK